MTMQMTFRVPLADGGGPVVTEPRSLDRTRRLPVCDPPPAEEDIPPLAAQVAPGEILARVPARLLCRASTLAVVTVLAAVGTIAGAIIQPVQYLADGAALVYVRAVVCSADGRFVYSAGAGTGPSGSLPGAVTVFARDELTGELTMAQVAQADGCFADGLYGDSSLALSPDGANLYVTSYSLDTLVVFARDPGTGLLRFVTVLENGVGGVTGLSGVRDVAVSADGANLYAVGEGFATLAVFERNPADGSLSFLEVHRDGVGGVDGLLSPRAVAVSPDGLDVYAAGSADNAVAVFSREGASGRLSFVEVVRDGVGGVDGLAGASGLGLAPDGTHLYAAGAGDDAVAVFSRDGATGRLTFVEVLRDGVGGVDGLSGASSAVVSADGTSLYATGTDENAVAIFARDGATGGLSFAQVVRDGDGGVDGLDGVSATALSPDGASLYAAGTWDSAVAVFARDGGSGVLGFVEAQHYGDGPIGGTGGWADPAVSPDGAHVYESAGSAVVVWARAAVGGGLNLVEVERGELPWMTWDNAVALSPDGSNLYAVSTGGSAVAVFARDPVSGELTFVEAERDGIGGVDGLDGANGVALSPDGTSLYAVGHNEAALAVFARDVSDGRLTFVEVVRDGVNGVDGLADVLDVVMSPDGAHVYAVGEGDSAVAVFARNVPDGRLSFVEAERQGLWLPDRAAVSPDGALLLVSNEQADTLSVFSRDPASGEIDLIQALHDDEGGVSGLDGVIAVAWSDDSRTAFASGWRDRRVVVFSRPLGYPYLTFRGVWCPDGSYGLAASPDGAFVYARNAGALSVARMIAELLVDGFESGDLSAWSTVVP